jgi:hypothetical protein
VERDLPVVLKGWVIVSVYLYLACGAHVPVVPSVGDSCECLSEAHLGGGGGRHCLFSRNNWIFFSVLLELAGGAQLRVFPRGVGIC